MNVINVMLGIISKFIRNEILLNKLRTYSLWVPNNEDPVTECEKCVKNANCLGGDVIDVDSGYWRFNNDSSLVLYCANAPFNCLGGTENFTCSARHIGPLCEICDLDNGYTRAGSFKVYIYIN
jgi:hypothetical protein